LDGTFFHAQWFSLEFTDSQRNLQVMPAKSKAQQRAAGAALSAKRGETKISALKGASREMVESMTEKELEELASTKQKGLPEHKDA
jgi:predicted exporter